MSVEQATEKGIEPAGAFRYELEIAIDAPRERVWEALVQETDLWWHPGFYVTERPSRMVLELEVGGRLYEVSEGGAALLWFRVIAIEPGRSLDLQGPLTPKYGGPGITLVGLRLEGDAERTVLRVSDAVFGAVTDKLRASLESGWRLLFTEGLKAWVEGGAAGDAGQGAAASEALVET